MLHIELRVLRSDRRYRSPRCTPTSRSRLAPGTWCRSWRSWATSSLPSPVPYPICRRATHHRASTSDLASLGTLALTPQSWQLRGLSEQACVRSVCSSIRTRPRLSFSRPAVSFSRVIPRLASEAVGVTTRSTSSKVMRAACDSRLLRSLTVTPSAAPL